MAKQTNGINGGYRGRVGNAVGYEWRGQWCVRSKPRFYHDAQSASQLAQRALFKATVAFAGRVKEVVRVGLHSPAVELHKTECNFFLQVNKRCFSMQEDALQVDYASLVVSMGPVAPVAFGAVTRVDAVTLRLHYEKNPLHMRANADDKVYLAAFTEEGDAELSLPTYRRTKEITFALPREWQGRRLHLYGFVQDNAGRTSESTYLGCFDTITPPCPPQGGTTADAATSSLEDTVRGEEVEDGNRDTVVNEGPEPLEITEGRSGAAYKGHRET